ncbi:MAG: Crp/Fnr family transcriptional regulator [Rhodocyclaceae bacterium]|nr:MAG: Crp/Fnr family transcriptional regulator [Rhodocyclaceae bacterium]
MIAGINTSLPQALQTLLPVELQRQCSSRTCARGDVLFKQGKKPVQFLFVSHGEVVLQRLGAQGETVILQRSRHGFIAEASLNSARYHCDAVVTRSGEIISMPLESIKQALDSDPGFSSRWITMLNNEVKRLRAQCERLSKKGVKERLLHLIETDGSKGRLLMGSDLKSMAAELGVTHEALYRTVAELERAKILVRRDGHIIRL